MTKLESKARHPSVMNATATIQPEPISVTPTGSPTFSLVLHIHPTLVSKLAPILPIALGLLLVATAGGYLIDAYSAHEIDRAYQRMLWEDDKSLQEAPNRSTMKDAHDGQMV